MVSNGSRRPVKPNQANQSFLSQAGEQFSYIYDRIYNSLRPKPQQSVGKKKRLDSSNQNTPNKLFENAKNTLDIENFPKTQQIASTPDARKLKELESKIDWLVGQQAMQFGGLGDDSLLAEFQTPKSFVVFDQLNDLGPEKVSPSNNKQKRLIQSKSPKILEHKPVIKRPILAKSDSMPVRSRDFMDALMLEMKTHKLKKPSLSFEPAKKTHLMTELQLRFAQMEKENEW